MKDAGAAMVHGLLASQDPCVEYKARAMLLGEPERTPRMAALRRAVRTSRRARQLLSHRQRNGTIATHPYRKWQGPHWTLYSLAQMNYPPGDRSLRPIRDQVYEWLLEPAHLEYPRSLAIRGQEERFRRCASQEGNAVWYSIRLGIEDERTREFVERLKRWQWPDGGWNCDKRPQARTSSVIESLIPLRALALAGRHYKDAGARRAAGRAAEYFLRRHLFRRLGDDQPILERFFLIRYPIQFYDILFALLVMAEIGKIRDPRCQEALDLLRAKQRPDGGFPVEMRTARTARRIVTNGTYADWGLAGKRGPNPLVTIDALWVLKRAGPAVA